MHVVRLVDRKGRLSLAQLGDGKNDRKVSHPYFKKNFMYKYNEYNLL
jgi:hypothetical protein